MDVFHLSLAVLIINFNNNANVLRTVHQIIVFGTVENAGNFQVSFVVTLNSIIIVSVKRLKGHVKLVQIINLALIRFVQILQLLMA
jgi:hypothetical protein